MSGKYSFRGSPASDFSVENLWSRTTNIAPSPNVTSNLLTTPMNLNSLTEPLTTPLVTPIPTPLILRLSTSEFTEGTSGPNTPDIRFTKTLPLPVKVNWCWVTLQGHSGSFKLEANIPGAPYIGGTNSIPFTCFVTENYQDVVRANVATTPVTPEQDPTLTTGSSPTYSPIELIGQTYTGLRDLSTETSLIPSDPAVQGWIFGVYQGNYLTTGANSVVLNRGENSCFFTESIYLDNSGSTSVLVFKFKVYFVNPVLDENDNPTNISFNGSESIWIHYQPESSISG